MTEHPLPPQVINGSPVMAYAPQIRINQTPDPYTFTILVFLSHNAVTPYCVSTWFAELANGWLWGHYFATYQEARDFFITRI